MQKRSSTTSSIALAYLGAVFLAGLIAAGTARVNAQVAVATYHADNQRTGCNQQETTLNAASFPSNFGIIATVTLDDQVDAQPLIVSGLIIAGGLHDVVYVATQSNTVYAIDATSGAILLSRNLGPPVPAPLGCTNNGPHVGINGTPIIDLGSQTLFVIAYVNGSQPTYYLHALNLTDLSDKNLGSGNPNPRIVSASHQLTNGSTATFHAAYQRQRPGLLLQHGYAYAGFGGFCDFSANWSRGWLLGWNAGTLAPLTASQLDNTRTSDPSVKPPFF